MSKDLNHFNESGVAHMVDVGTKEITRRTAVTEGRIIMHAQTLQLIMQGEPKKGDVLGVARIAGIMAAKKTADLVPLCHPIALSHVEIELNIDTELPGVYCRATVECNGVTGVEMEALTAVQITLLTIYDMCKAVDRGMQITDVCLLKKAGGKTGVWRKGDG